MILLAGEFLKQSKALLEDGIPARTLIKAVRKATKVVLDKVSADAFDLNSCSEEERTRMLMRCAGTSMSSKLIANHTEFFSKMVVDAVNTLDEQLPLDMIGIKKVQGEPYCLLVYTQQWREDSRNSKFALGRAF